MNVRFTLAVAATAAVLSACAAEPPFVLTDYRSLQLGYVKVCYSTENTTPEKVFALAETECSRYDRTARLQIQQLGQCSWTAPTVATFVCEARPGETPPPLVIRNAPMRHDANSLGTMY